MAYPRTFQELPSALQRTYLLMASRGKLKASRSAKWKWEGSVAELWELARED